MERGVGGAKASNRVAVYNGDDTAPSWSFVDGGGPRGLGNLLYNADDPTLLSHNNKLYAFWTEYETSEPFMYTVHGAVFKGLGASPLWQSIDAHSDGLSQRRSSYTFEPRAIVFESKLYLTWNESNEAQRLQVRMAVFNDDDDSPAWTFIEGTAAHTLNKDPAAQTTNNRPIGYDSKLYLFWAEGSRTVRSQIRGAVYNGDDSSPHWDFVDGNGTTGFNKDVDKDAFPLDVVIFNGRIYATWAEQNATDILQIRVAVIQ
jgi:hypothetical protein